MGRVHNGRLQSDAGSLAWNVRFGLGGGVQLYRDAGHGSKRPNVHFQMNTAEHQYGRSEDKVLGCPLDESGHR